MNQIKVKHSFNSGDLITVLPGLQHLYKTTNRKTIIYQVLDFPAYYYDGAQHPVKDETGQQVCMNKSMFEMMKPLLEAQDYIESFEVWQGEQVDINFDATRDSRAIPMPNGDIHFWPFFVAPDLQCDLSEEWIRTMFGYYSGVEIIMEKSKYEIDGIVINRTSRYTNPYISYHFLKKYSVHFIGTKDEYEDFCSSYKVVNAIFLKCDNLLDAARFIKHSKLFIGNQSLCWHLADAMKVPRLLEVCSVFPNTFPTGANGYAFLKQECLEFYVDKILNK